MFDEPVLQRICDVIGDTGSGIIGSEIGSRLARLGIHDPSPTMTKCRRLFEALVQRQRSDRCGNNVVAFIYDVMNPVNYTGRCQDFEARRQALNEILVFSGYALGEDGKLNKIAAVKTLGEAEERASRLKVELIRRGIHSDVLSFCRAELLQNNYFHAVLEATKSVADKIRRISGRSEDGSELVDRAFGLGSAGMPLIAFNTLRSDAEKSEHTGLMNLMKGIFGTFRNVTAHAPKVYWCITEQDALDLLSIASFLHRRLDSAGRTTRQ